MQPTEPIPKLAAVKESLTSVREALEVLGGKWKIPVIVSLASGSKRFNQLRCDMTGITSKILSRELKQLESNNLIVRRVDEEMNIVHYVVTNKCKSLEKVIEGLKEWGDYHRSNIFQRPINTHSIMHFRRQEEEQTIDK